MTSRDDLIEEAAKAILDDYDGCFERLAGTDPEEPLSTDEEDAEFWRKRARVALAVFDQAHAPTDDERPTIELARSIASWDQGAEATNRIPHWAANLAMHLRELGFRRTVQGEPTKRENGSEQ